MPATPSRRPRAALLAALLPLAALAGACTSDAPLSPHAAPSASLDAARKPAAGITLVLDLQPDGAHDVPFTATGRPLKDFSLDDDADPALPNAITFAKARQGTYTVQAGAVAGVTLESVVCVSDANGGAAVDNNTVDLATGTATIRLERNEAVTCTFTATAPPVQQTWQIGEVISYSQDTWGDEVSAAGMLLLSSYNAVYAATFGVLEVGLPDDAGYSIQITNRDAVIAYLPPPGAPGALTGNHTNPGATAAGTFGGEVVGLRLNIDFADAGLTLGTSGVPFGDLRLCGVTTYPLLNGLTVRQYLGVVNTLLGGGTGSYSIAQLSPFTAQINRSFEGGEPSQFAQDNLINGTCPSAEAWQDGEVISYAQDSWGGTQAPGSAAQLVFDNYDAVYVSTFGVFQVGITGDGGFSMTFTSRAGVLAYLPPSGVAGALTGDYVDPGTTAAGTFGGEVVALRLNIDFADAGVTLGTSGARFGDLRVCNVTAYPLLNGLTVRQYMGVVDTLLGGGSGNYSIAQLTVVTAELNRSFEGGEVSVWAQDHLVAGACP